MYPFQFVLPFGLPSSFVGEFGSVKYSLDAVIGQSWAFDCKSHAIFQVVSVVDLNVEHTAQVPIITKACKTFGIIFQSGPLDVTLRLPKGGAAIGETVPFIAEVFNKSDKTVTECLSILKVNIFADSLVVLSISIAMSCTQEIEYFARGKSKNQSKTVVEVLGQALQPGADHIWQENRLTIPQTEPSTLGRCRIINVKYKVLVS